MPSAETLSNPQVLLANLEAAANEVASVKSAIKNDRRFFSSLGYLNAAQSYIEAARQELFGMVREKLEAEKLEEEE